MSAIADESGINRASIYYYFSGKDELLAELLEEAIPQVAGLAQSIISQDISPAEKLRQLIVAAMSAYGNAPVLYMFFREDSSSLDASAPDLFQVVGREIQSGVFRRN